MRFVPSVAGRQITSNSFTCLEPLSFDVYLRAKIAQVRTPSITHQEKVSNLNRVQDEVHRKACQRKKQIHRRPIGVLVNVQKKSGWNGSLTLPLDRGVKKEFQTNRIKAQCPRAALQSHSAASGL